MEAGALHRSGRKPNVFGQEPSRANVVRAFSCHFPYVVTGRNILLVDDVLTSGATADGCVRALMAGAAKVYVLTFGVSVADERDWLRGSRVRLKGQLADCL